MFKAPYSKHQSHAQDEDFHRRTPLVSNSRRTNNRPSQQRQLYTPAHFTLSKNPHLNMDGNRPEVFSPNTIRMTDSLDKLLRDDDEDDTLGDTGGGGNMPATPQPLKFDGRSGAFEPPKASMNRLRGAGVDAHAPTGEGSLHTPKPQRVMGARYGREDAMMHHPHPMGHYHDPYQNNRVQPIQHHDPFFTPLVEDPYHDMHQYGPIPPTVVSPLTIPEYNAYPMHAASWSPIPPEFGVGRRDPHWGQLQPPPPAEFHPLNAGYDRHYHQMHMHPPHNQHSHYHLPGNVSPFMPHYNNPYPPHHAPYLQQSAPMSPQADGENQYSGSNEHSPRGRPRKDSSASINSGHSSKSVENMVSPKYRSGLQNSSSDDELNWFVPHSISGESVSRGVYQPSSLQARGSLAYSEKKQGKKVNVKQAKDGSRQTTQQLNKTFHAKGLRPSTAAANSATSQEFLESPAERAAFKVGSSNCMEVVCLLIASHRSYYLFD